MPDQPDDGYLHAYTMLGKLSDRPIKPVNKYTVCDACRTIYYNDVLLAHYSLFCPDGCGNALRMLEEGDAMMADKIFGEYERREA